MLSSISRNNLSPIEEKNINYMIRPTPAGIAAYLKGNLFTKHIYQFSSVLGFPPWLSSVGARHYSREVLTRVSTEGSKYPCSPFQVQKLGDAW